MSQNCEFSSKFWFLKKIFQNSYVSQNSEVFLRIQKIFFHRIPMFFSKSLLLSRISKVFPQNSQNSDFSYNYFSEFLRFSEFRLFLGILIFFPPQNSNFSKFQLFSQNFFLRIPTFPGILSQNSVVLRIPVFKKFQIFSQNSKVFSKFWLFSQISFSEFWCFSEFRLFRLIQTLFKFKITLLIPREQ